MIVKATFVLATVILTALLAWNILVALQAESLLTAGPRLAADAWGWVTILDVYLGFIVFGGYLCAREGRARHALPWLAGILVLGNVVTAAYLLWALWVARGDFTALVRPAR